MARKPDEWMPLHVRKYLGDTMHLTRDQHGAYLLLLMAYWMRGGPLPANDNELAAIARATKPEWARLKIALAPFFEVVDGKWVQKRAEEELTKARKLTLAKSEAGARGAKNRWHNDSTANGETMAQPSPSHKQTDAPLPLPKPVSLNSFVVGKGKSSDPMSDDNKIALFQKWLATSIGKNGWQIVGVAADPNSEGYSEAVEFCRKHAKKHGKGWPHKWPVPGVAA